jgi:hypothetical protein
MAEDDIFKHGFRDTQQVRYFDVYLCALCRDGCALEVYLDQMNDAFHIYTTNLSRLFCVNIIKG